jgi:hypothetical protein
MPSELQSLVAYLFFYTLTPSKIQKTYKRRHRVFQKKALPDSGNEAI